ncbi:MAG: thymidylate synthase [Candidatus Brocadiia bacterium]
MSYITVTCDTLPEAWEQAVLRCWEEGDRIRTEYDKPTDPESRDCTVMIVARRPFQEPRIHKAFPGSLEDLEIYRQEVVEGIHDHWVNPEEGKWSYTYHQRLFAYDLFGPDGKKRAINQFDYLIEKLASAPHSRRAQAITWKPDVDPAVDDPACLQRMWFRIHGDELRMNVHMRSNDAYKAAFMNMWAFTALQQFVAEAVSRRAHRTLRPGAYAHIADSFHIYGSYFREFEGFLNSVRKRSFAERTWDSTSDFVQSAFESARAQIAQEQKGGHAKP